MARIAVDPNYNSPTFPRATAAADIFVKEDIQALAAAVSTHTHDGAGKGLAITSIPVGAIADGSITGVKIATNTLDNPRFANQSVNARVLQDAQISAVKMAANAVTQVRQATGSTANPTTTSTSLVDIPELILTFTPGGPDAVSTSLLIWMDLTCFGSAVSALATFAINVDGADVTSRHFSPPIAGISGLVTITLVFTVSATAASHTVKGRWSTGSGTLTNNQTQRELTVLELRR